MYINNKQHKYTTCFIRKEHPQKKVRKTKKNNISNKKTKYIG